MINWIDTTNHNSDTHHLALVIENFRKLAYSAVFQIWRLHYSPEFTNIVCDGDVWRPGGGATCKNDHLWMVPMSNKSMG